MCCHYYLFLNSIYTFFAVWPEVCPSLIPCIDFVWFCYDLPKMHQKNLEDITNYWYDFYYFLKIYFRDRKATYKLLHYNLVYGTWNKWCILELHAFSTTSQQNRSGLMIYYLKSNFVLLDSYLHCRMATSSSLFPQLLTARSHRFLMAMCFSCLWGWVEGKTFG